MKRPVRDGVILYCQVRSVTVRTRDRMRQEEDTGAAEQGLEDAVAWAWPCRGRGGRVGP